MSCGSARCSGTFGFWLYHVPPRVEDDLRHEAKQEQERRAKQREACAARVARAARKAGGGATDAARQWQAEQLFCAALVDACPRCGLEPPRSATKEELVEHLQACTDKRKHATHRAAVQAAEAKNERKEEKQEAQAEATNLAVWQFLGGDDSQAWLLTDTQVSPPCAVIRAVLVCAWHVRVRTRGSEAVQGTEPCRRPELQPPLSPPPSP